MDGRQPLPWDYVRVARHPTEIGVKPPNRAFNFSKGAFWPALTGVFPGR